MIWEIFNAFFNLSTIDLTGRHPKSFTILSFLPINNGTSLERILFLSINNAINFLKKNCLERLNQEFNKNYKDFNPHQFLQNYHDFLMYAGYYHFGIVRTGAYLIWRALIKYLEDLQGEDEFHIVIDSTGDLNIDIMLNFSQIMFYIDISTTSIVIFLITGIKCLIAKREIFR